MFARQRCVVRKDALRKYEKSDSYFQNVVLDEDARVNDLRAQEILATTENPRIKLQEVTTDICKELRDYKSKEILEQKRRQQLRTNNEDLRLLQTQLKAALVSQQLAEQNKLIKQQREEELRKKRQENVEWTAECEKLRTATLRQEELDREKKVEFRMLLKQQMNEIQAERKRQFEATLKDREDMQKALKRLQADQKAEKLKKMRFSEDCKREMEEFLRDKEIEKKIWSEKHTDDAEERWAYQKERDDLNIRLITKRKHKLASKMALSEKIGSKMAALKKESTMREELFLSLLVEERNAKEDEKYRRKLDKQIQDRNQLRVEMENYHQELLVQKGRLFQEERQMQEENMRHLAERDRLDQHFEEKRRKKVTEHNRALRDMIEERREQRVRTVANKITDFHTAMTSEKESQKRIEEERIRMLKATPKELLRYLPPGVIKPSDLEYISIS